MKKEKQILNYFKDSCFVEFSSEQEAEKAKAAGELKIKDGENEKNITSELRVSYHDRKKQERKEKSKKRSSEDTEENENNNSLESTKDEEEDKPNKKQKREPVKEEKKELPKGVFVGFKGVGPDQSRETIKEVFSPYGTIQYVDFAKGLTEGYLRFSTHEEAQKAVSELNTSKQQIGGQVPEVYLLEGETEAEYLKKVEEDQNKKKKGGKGGRGGGRGGRGGKKRKRF